jgi:hypothetical protein
MQSSQLAAQSMLAFTLASMVMLLSLLLYAFI